jgi:hypothetical protein
MHNTVVLLTHGSLHSATRLLVVGNQATTAWFDDTYLLDRLMSWTILTETNRIVRHDEECAQIAQSRQGYTSCMRTSDTSTMTNVNRSDC